jgi:hypothetical protein
MSPAVINVVVWLVAIVLVILAFSARRRSRGHVGPGAAGSLHDLLNEDKRNAVEIIVEERAAARDPEDRDGNLPDLEDPTRVQRRR